MPSLLPGTAIQANSIPATQFVSVSAPPKISNIAVTNSGYTPIGGNLSVSTGGYIRITGTTNPTLNQWYHVAWSRSSGSTRMFINGVQEGSTYSDTNNYTCTSGYPLIGSRPSQTTVMTGYIADLRVTRGVARYTTTFTTASTPFIRR